MCIFCVCSNAHERRFSWRPQEGVEFPRAALRGRVHSCLWAQTGQLWAARVRTGNLIWSSAIVARFLAAGPASVFNRFSRQHWVFCVLWSCSVKCDMFGSLLTHVLFFSYSWLTTLARTPSMKLNGWNRSLWYLFFFFHLKERDFHAHNYVW